MKKLTSTLLTIVLTLCFAFGLNYFLPKITNTNLNFYDEESLRILSHQPLKIIYHKGCSFSPCPAAEVIFEGQTSEKGSITLPTWHTKNFNPCGISDLYYHCYEFELKGEKKNYIYIQRGRGKSIFFL